MYFSLGCDHVLAANPLVDASVNCMPKVKHELGLVLTEPEGRICKASVLIPTVHPSRTTHQ